LGIFHRLTGALSSNGLEVLSAEIHSLADGLCLDRFYVHDNDYRDQPPQDRIDSVTDSLVKSLKEKSGQPPTFRRTWQSDVKQEATQLNRLPTKIRVDNSTSDRYTIIDIFTHDQQGLLYTIARTLFELKLSVASARIGTYLDQVVDVFYVTDSGGQKVQGEGNHQRIRSVLSKAIDDPPADTD
jgi:[protein-PII] uridylyltransferase